MVRDDKHLEQRGMKVSRRWAECMCVKESEVRRKDKAVRSRVVKKMDEIKYLGSTIQRNGQ